MQHPSDHRGDEITAFANVPPQIIKGSEIPVQILSEILLRIDDIRTIGYVCPLVCRQWNDVLMAPGFWINYMQYRSVTLPPPSLRKIPELNIKKVALLQPFGRNLLTNPSGEEAYNGWRITSNGGSGFQIECPPEGCSSCLEEDIPVAFATSHDWCRKHQIVDLWKEGIEVR
ncbi:unnamed protein product [Gongylonema pulchrum]|uniref:FBA domain-containing protein n=1 Tax=Gongylonema pulchrum TaxID=637853 RepID=A0A183DW53_9BILA|nr:unnamed protein product [Gongylonema pulchrum]